MKLLWNEEAWEQYCSWQSQDKKTLKRINTLIKDIQRSSYVRDSIAVLKAQSTRTTAWLDPIGGSKNSGKHDFSDLVIQMEEKKELYRTLVEHHSLMFVQISRIIDNVEDKRIRIVLRKKYLELCSVATIAQQLDRSEKHIYRLLKEGLQVIKLPDSVYKEYEHRPRYFQR